MKLTIPPEAMTNNIGQIIPNAKAIRGTPFACHRSVSHDASRGMYVATHRACGLTLPAAWRTQKGCVAAVVEFWRNCSEDYRTRLLSLKLISDAPKATRVERDALKAVAHVVMFGSAANQEG